MFEQTPSNLPISQEPEDILEKVAPVALARPITPPLPSRPAGGPVSPPPSILPKETMTIETPHQGMKRLFFVLGIVLGIVVVGGISWFFISQAFKKTAAPAITPPPASLPTTEVIPPPAPATTSTSEVLPSAPPVIPPINAPTISPSALDSDGDGLSNAEEAQLGTNPNLIDTDNDGLTDFEEVKIYHTDPLKKDTDGDGLTDFEEVKIYHTNPLNPDTDGDGYSDGKEVRGGYNPLVAGK